MKQLIISRLTPWFDKLLKRRKHNQSHLVLKHQNMYVVPSKFGLGFIFFAILIFSLGSNYQNNLVLLCAYLLFALFFISILQSYLNLIDTQVRFVSAQDGYAHSGYKIVFSMQNINQAFSVFVINNNKHVEINTINEEKTVYQLQVEGLQRGKHQIARLKIQSRYPFGIATVWSYVLFPNEIYIYPTPVPFSLHQYNIKSEGEGDQQNQEYKTGTDEFFSIREFIEGESISRISWKHYAKTQTLMVKEFNEYQSQQFMFSLEQVPGDYETKLQHLSYLINQAYHDEIIYGLKLANKLIKPDHGITHMTKCLRALSEA